MKFGGWWRYKNANYDVYKNMHCKDWLKGCIWLEMYKKEYSKGPFHLKYHRVYMKNIDL